MLNPLLPCEAHAIEAVFVASCASILDSPCISSTLLAMKMQPSCKKPWPLPCQKLWPLPWASFGHSFQNKLKAFSSSYLHSFPEHCKAGLLKTPQGASIIVILFVHFMVTIHQGGNLIFSSDQGVNVSFSEVTKDSELPLARLFDFKNSMTGSL